MSFAQKITSVLIGLLLLVGSLIGIFAYQTSYREVETSVGIETVGCANITTGLVDPEAVSRLASGDRSGLAELEEQLNWTVEHKSLFKEVFLMSLDGTILAADQNLKRRGYQAGDAFYFNEQDRNMILEMKHPVYTKVYSYDGVKLLTGYGPIFKNHDPNEEIIGLMVINFDASIIGERTRDILLLPFIIGIVVLLAAVVFVYFFIHRMIRPLETLSRQVERVAEGDLTVQTNVRQGKDEIGKLTQNFAKMVSSLRELITEVNGTSMHVASSSEQLSASAQQIGKAGEHAAEITQSLADGSERQLTNLETGATMLHDMSERIGQIARHAEGVLASAQQVSDASNQGEQAIQSSVAQMSTMEAKIIHLSAIVEELGSRSKEVQSILDIMTDIAAETNLLALNASIEAARAGEYGSGFAVVASSVRKLAERSAASAQQISELITHIVGQVELTSSAMDETVRETKRGVELVSSAGASFSDIAASTEITAASIADISEAVRLLSNNSQRLVKSIDDIVKFAGQTAVSAQEMSSFSQQQLAAMEEVDASASFLSSLAERLHSMIERFKVM